MSLLLLLASGCPPEDTALPGAGAPTVAPDELLQAMLDAIHKEDDRVGGQAVTRLTALVAEDETICIEVESTIGFGEYTDGTESARILINGEIIEAITRNRTTPFGFGKLTRGALGTTAQLHHEGSLVFDLSRNTSAIDHVRRGILVNFALGADLDVIGRNLGLIKCAGLGDEAWRRIIKAIAYLPKQTIDAFQRALFALFDDDALFSISERIISDPWKVFVEITIALSTSIRGRFVLNGGEPQLTTGASSVDTGYAINHVLGVYDDTVLTRRGFRDGFTNYATTDTFAGSTITLDSSPGGAGTAVIVDYGAFAAHYLALDETVRDAVDVWAYLSDPLFTAGCLLEQIRAAGIRVELSAKL